MDRSALKRHSPRIGDPNAHCLYNRPARIRDDLPLFRCESPWTRFAIIARSNPWARTSRSSVTPYGMLASSASARRLFLAEAWFSWKRRHTCKS
jgi:hypothetical protein